MGSGSLSKSFRDRGDIKPLFDALLELVPNGQLNNAKRMVKKLSKNDRAAVTRLTDDHGWTLLFHASFHGHTAFVNFLLEECSADIEQQCMCESLPMESEFYSVTPLCCAALEGNLDVVKTLVVHGADVNDATGTQRTPANAACLGNDIQVVRYLVQKGADISRPGTHGRTCLMFSVRNVELCHYLFEQNASLGINAVDDLGNSALHYAIFLDSFDCVKLLMEQGADPSIENIDGYDALAVAVRSLRPTVSSTTDILQYLIQELKATTPRSADMHALLAAIMTVDTNYFMVDQALHFWTQSVNIRMDENFVAESSEAVRPKAAYNFAVEVADIDSLMNIADDSDAMNMQALLVLDRILGPNHPITIRALEQCANHYDTLGANQRVVDMMLYALHNSWPDLTELDSPMSCRMALLSIWCAFLGLDYDFASSIRFADLHNVLEWMVENLGTLMSSLAAMMGIDIMGQQESLLNRVIEFIRLMCGLTLTDVEKLSFDQLVRDLVRARFRTSDRRTLLHVAVGTEWSHPSVVECWLEAGAPVNAVDLCGNTPLHVAACSRPTEEWDWESEDWEKEDSQKVIELLLKHDAHVDIANANREFASDTLPPKVAFNHLTLKCIASRAVRHYQLQYRGTVPATLADFVDRH